jgi:aminoglycoside 6'-N-acetyltransferase
LTSLRPAAEADVDLLVGWHADPDVARFWDGKTYTSTEMVERLARPHVEAYVVEADGEPVGYLQAWRGEGGEGGLDMFLVPEARGRGLGPDAAAALAGHLVRDRGWTRVTVDPYLWNERAIRGWRRAGFEPLEERPADDEHMAPWLLMEFRR